MNSEDAQQEDALAVCDALRDAFKQLGLSSADVEKLTEIPASSIRRIQNGTYEPKPSQIAHIERSLDLAAGTIYRSAGLIECDSVKKLLMTDPQLHPIFRKAGVGHYEEWVTLSTELSSKD